MKDMKIGIMGAHGTGKTMFARQMASRIAEVPDVERVSVIGGIARRCPWPINQKASDTAQRWIWLTHKVSELEASDKGGVIICDRTLLDALVYAAVAGLDAVVDDYLPATLEWMGTYDTVYWMRPAAGYLLDDGKRDVDPAFQMDVDRVFGEWIGMFGVDVTEIDEG